MKNLNRLSLASATCAALVCLTPAIAQQSTQAPASKPMQTAQTDKAMTPEAVDGMFAKLDANKDGMIDKAEAAKMPGLLDVFDKFDTDKRGKIDKGQFAAAVASLSK